MGHFRRALSKALCVMHNWDNKVKLTTRKSYGFRTYEAIETEAIETTLYHNLGALPEPDFTHRFW